MKKWIALVLALLLALTLFSGCGETPAATTEKPANTAKQAETSKPAENSGEKSQTAAPATDPDSPYCFAAGKYEKTADGFPATKYVYDQPLCTNDSVLTKWCSCYTPQYIPEGGYGTIPTWVELRELTGVQIEYDVVASANRAENFSVLLASDALDDLLDGAPSYYKAGTLKSAVEDGYFANFADYTDYLPNYLWEICDRAQYQTDMIYKLYYDDETIPTLYGLVCDPCPAMGIFLRQDWMDELNLGKASDVKTYDQFHDVIKAMKVNYSKTEEIFPLYVTASIDKYQGLYFSGFDTTVYTTNLNTYPRIKDGKVELCGATDDDLAAMTVLTGWYKEGLMSPNFQSFETANSDTASTGIYNDGLGCYPMSPSLWEGVEENSENPNADWEPAPRLKKTEDQVLKYGFAKARDNYSYSSICVAGRCENIPLAVSWIDWAFSDFGSDFWSFGSEGYLWEYNDQGERRLTDFCMNHEAGTTWIMCLYAANSLGETCLFQNMRNNYYEGGERLMEAYNTWAIPGYKGEYDWPSAITFTDEERDENASIFADLNTYYQENAVAFVNCSKPLTEWDAFIEGLNGFGYSRVQEIYQNAYDRYLARVMG